MTPALVRKLQVLARRLDKLRREIAELRFDVELGYYTARPAPPRRRRRGPRA